MIFPQIGKLRLGAFECIDDAKSLMFFFIPHIFIFIISCEVNSKISLLQQWEEVTLYT